MLPQCPKKVMNSAMDTPESREWCERNRDPTKCHDCPVYPQSTKCAANTIASKKQEQLGLF